MPTSGSIDARLNAQHLEDTDRIRLNTLFARALGALDRLCHRTPAAACWVPGRIEIFGKHTDYAGGRSLIATVPRGFAFVGAPRTDGLVRVVSAETGDLREFHASRPSPSSSADWGRYVSTVVTRLSRNFAPMVTGADLAFVSDLPVAAGISSSSALTVGTAMSLVRLNRLDAHAAWERQLDSPIAVASYLACVESGRTYGELAGAAGVGTLSGSEDHTAMLCCRREYVSAYAYVPVRHIEDAPMPAGWAFVIAASGVLAEKTGAAQALYNRAARGTAALLEIWNSANTPEPSLAAALQLDDAEPRLRALVDDCGRSDFSPAELHERLSHFIAEDGRILPACRAFGRQDAPALGVLAAASQRDAAVLLRNQIPETEALAGHALDQGAWASCAFGAGFGGSVWALVSRDEATAFGSRWVAAYARQFPAHHGAAWFIARPGPAMIDIAL